MHRRALFVLALAAFGACEGGCEGACKEEDKAAVAREDLRKRADAWFSLHGSTLCPLKSPDAWIPPTSAVTVEPIDEPKGLFKAVMPFWCRGEGDGGSRRISAVATVPPEAPWIFDYKAATISQVEEVGFWRLMGEWFFVPTIVVVLAALVARFVPLFLIAGALNDVLLIVGFLIHWLGSPRLMLVFIGIGSVVGSCMWTYGVFHTDWAFLLTPVQFVPTFVLLAAAFMRAWRKDQEGS